MSDDDKPAVEFDSPPVDEFIVDAVTIMQPGPTWATAEEIDAAIPETEWTPEDEAKAQAIGAEVGRIGREFFRSAGSSSRQAAVDAVLSGGIPIHKGHIREVLDVAYDAGYIIWTDEHRDQVKALRATITDMATAIEFHLEGDRRLGRERLRAVLAAAREVASR